MLRGIVCIATKSLNQKIHFSKHSERDKLEYNNDQLFCVCGKYFSEFHYFENHLLQTGHKNDTNRLDSFRNQATAEEDTVTNNIELKVNIYTYGTVYSSNTGECLLNY